MGEIEEKVFVPLKEKKIIRPIRRSRNPMVSDPAHEAFFLFGNASIDYALPMDRQGNLINPFSSKGEQKWLERELDLDLNIYRNKDNYWMTFKVKMGKGEKMLDLSNPKHYIEYLVLKANKLFIAPSGDKQFDRATYRYVMLNPEYETNTEAKAIDKKIEAYKALGKLEDDSTAMVDFLKIYGKKVDDSSKKEFLVAEINKVIEKSVDDFLTLYNDKENYEVRLLIARAVESGVIEKKGRKYNLPGGDPLCGEGSVATIDNVIAYLKSPAQQDMLSMIQARVKNAKD